MAKVRAVFRCSECGGAAPKWAGRCPACGEWNTLAEESDEPVVDRSGHRRTFAVDEHPRRDTSMEKLASLKPLHPEIEGATGYRLTVTGPVHISAFPTLKLVAEDVGMAQSAGDSVSDTINEMMVAPAMVSANCR